MTDAHRIDELMERASLALAKMDYLHCESLSLQALALAREKGDWDSYSRILLPLQESRRQRRIIAAEGTVRLGTTDLQGPAERWSDGHVPCCIVVTRPHTAADALALWRDAQERQGHVEVLFADCEAASRLWCLRSFAGPSVARPINAPPTHWINRWLEPATPAEGMPHMTPAAWFLAACETLGDGAYRQVAAPLGSVDRVLALEQCLSVVTDHEIIHQRLADAARAVRSPATSAPGPDRSSR